MADPRPASSDELSVRGYLAVYALLLACLAGTIGFAYADLAAANFVVGLGLAGIKAGLILIYFMDLRRSQASTVLAALAGFAWLGILLALLAADYGSRGGNPAF